MAHATTTFLVTTQETNDSTPLSYAGIPEFLALAHFLLEPPHFPFKAIDAIEGIVQAAGIH
jgi:hypothetical protein